MIYDFNSINKVSRNYDKNYLIKRWEYYSCEEEGYKDMQRIYELMKYTIKRNDIFKNISFILAISTTGKSQYSAPNRNKISTKGRPKYCITGGKNKPPHIHIACFGPRCPTFVKLITNKLNKRAYKSLDEFYKRNTKSRRLYTYDKLNGENNGLDYIPYIYNLASSNTTAIHQC